jgi:hypothetical protein
MLRLRTRGVTPNISHTSTHLNTENILPLEILLVLSQIRKRASSSYSYHLIYHDFAENLILLIILKTFRATAGTCMLEFCMYTTHVQLHNKFGIPNIVIYSSRVFLKFVQVNVRLTCPTVSKLTSSNFLSLSSWLFTTFKPLDPIIQPISS